MTEIISAGYHANGISGEPYYAAIVRDPFGDTHDDREGLFVVTTFENSGHTSVLKLDDLAAGDATADAHDFRGGVVGANLRAAIIAAARAHAAEAARL